LVADAVWHTWYSTDVFEYVVIWAITLFMIFIGFMEGLGIGVLLACGKSSI